MIELGRGEDLDRALVGGKAYHLNHLLSLGLMVPPTIVIPVGEAPDVEEIALGAIGTADPAAHGVWPSAAPRTSKTPPANRGPDIT